MMFMGEQHLRRENQRVGKSTKVLRMMESLKLLGKQARPTTVRNGHIKNHGQLLLVKIPITNFTKCTFTNCFSK
ncbi:hypothetical protein evm_001786 [Chilo suppressalis]|nr:hypothetical protein evm_001786 [Chilo suppressalis]